MLNNNLTYPFIETPEVFDEAGMSLWITDSLVILKRLNPTEMPLPIKVELDHNLIIFKTAKEQLELTFTLAEMRAIMRLFDVPQEAAHD